MLVSGLVQVLAGAAHRVVRVGVPPSIRSCGAYGVDDRQQLHPDSRWLVEQKSNAGTLRTPPSLLASHSTFQRAMARRLFVGAASSQTPPPKLLHICHNNAMLAPMPKNTAHQAAVNALLSEIERAEYARRVQALRSRNTLLTMLEATRETQGMTKRALASRAGLEASSVRRLLTSATANPTTDNAFRLMAAMGIALEAKLPTGERVELVSPGAPATTTESAAAA